MVKTEASLVCIFFFSSFRLFVQGGCMNGERDSKGVLLSESLVH